MTGKPIPAFGIMIIRDILALGSLITFMSMLTLWADIINGAMQ